MAATKTPQPRAEPATKLRPVEDHINRIKMIKRQVGGRASPDPASCSRDDHQGAASGKVGENQFQAALTSSAASGASGRRQAGLLSLSKRIQPFLKFLDSR